MKYHLFPAWSSFLTDVSTEVKAFSWTVLSGNGHLGTVVPSISDRSSACFGVTALNLADCLLTEGLVWKYSRDQSNKISQKCQGLCGLFITCITNYHLLATRSSFITDASSEVDGVVPSGSTQLANLASSTSDKLSPFGLIALNLADCLLTGCLAWNYSKDQPK